MFSGWAIIFRGLHKKYGTENIFGFFLMTFLIAFGVVAVTSVIYEDLAEQKAARSLEDSRMSHCVYIKSRRAELTDLTDGTVTHENLVVCTDYDTLETLTFFTEVWPQPQTGESFLLETKQYPGERLRTITDMSRLSGEVWWRGITIDTDTRIK